MHKSWTADTGHSAPNARQTVGKMNVDSRMKSGSEFHIQARILGQDTLPIPCVFSVIVLLLPSCWGSRLTGTFISYSKIVEVEMEWDAGVEPNWSRVRADWVVLVQK